MAGPLWAVESNVVFKFGLLVTDILGCISDTRSLWSAGTLTLRLDVSSRLGVLCWPLIWRPAVETGLYTNLLQ